MKNKKEVLEIFRKGALKPGGISFATVSGIVTTKPGMIRRIDSEIPEFSLITTKSYQIKPNTGNREPVIVEPEEGNFGNAVGLRNPGMIQGLKDLRILRGKKPLRAILNVSISGNSVEEFITLVKQFENTADILELNVSCPHAAGGYGMAIGADPEVVYTYVKEIRKVTNALIFPKLTPNVEAISEIALAAVEGGADGITAINTAGPRLYREPYSREPLLLNTSGNRGGMSGRWVKDMALKKVEEIRTAAGPDFPLIGVGGIETGKDVRNMMQAGANIVGIGSLFASVHPDNWKRFFKALKEDALNSTDTANVFRQRGRKMQYIPHTITSVTDLPGHIRVLECDGKVDFAPGQFAFLWIPGTGEKPFSIMNGSPLSFFIKKRGMLTSRIMELKKGMRIFVRGIYGKHSPDTDRNTVLIAAGGTGLAAALKLAENHHKKGKKVHTYYGMSLPGQEVMEERFLEWGTFTAAADEGVPGRVIDMMACRIGKPFGKQKQTPGNNSKQNLDCISTENCALYTIGPAPFMKKAAVSFIKAGGKKEDTFLSIETPTRCGIGLCGECECGGRLTCREGAFFSLDYLNMNSIKWEDYL